MTEQPPTTDNGTLILLSGMGADERLLALQRRQFPNLIVPPWLEAHRNETLAHYGERMADMVRERYPLTSPLVLGGVSFGGMVAQEMALHLKPSRLVLIATCRSRLGVPAHWRMGARLITFTPRRLLKSFTVLAPFGLKIMGGDIPGEHLAMLTDMFDQVDPALVQWSCRAILHWNGVDPQALHCPVVQIHGDADPLIPLRKVNSDIVIPGGKHLINVVHADAVNDVLQAQLAVGSG